jgi:SAM-dependent methyltransferase
MNKDGFESFVPQSFASPEMLPADAAEAEKWQQANRAFWENHPMRYDWTQPIVASGQSREFFAEVDRRFLSAVRSVMPWKDLPFEGLIDFGTLGSMDVLEIGVGMGTHAQLIAPRAKTYVGIDLTDYAAVATRRRFELNGINGTVLQMDAERMEFPDRSFDLIWTWGVIHHSANTSRILSEMHRVLRPAGRAIVMVYYRGWWNYYVCSCLIRGLLMGGIFKYGSLTKTVQAHCDGALARFYSVRSWRAAVRGLFTVESIGTNGNKADILPIPGGRVKDAILAATPDLVTRVMTRDLKMGSFLISKLRKGDDSTQASRCFRGSA